MIRGFLQPSSQEHTWGSGDWTLSPCQAHNAAYLILRIMMQVEGVTSEYWVNSKKSKSNAASHDRDVARKLWDVSSELTKADYSFLNA